MCVRDKNIKIHLKDMYNSGDGQGWGENVEPNLPPRPILKVGDKIHPHPHSYL